MNWLKNMLGKKSSPPVESGTSLRREADNLFVMVQGYGGRTARPPKPEKRRTGRPPLEFGLFELR